MTTNEIFTNVTQQPREIWHTIFSFLDNKSLINTSIACKFFKETSLIVKQQRIQEIIKEGMDILNKDITEFETQYETVMSKENRTQGKVKGLNYLGNLQYDLNPHPSNMSGKHGYDLIKFVTELRIKFLKMTIFLNKVNFLFEKENMTSITADFENLKTKFKTLGGDFHESDYAMDEKFLAGAPYVNVILYLSATGKSFTSLKTHGFYGNFAEVDLINDNIHPVLKDLLVNVKQINNHKDVLALLKAIEQKPDCLSYIQFYHARTRAYAGHDNGRRNHPDTLEKLIQFVENNIQDMDLRANNCRIM